jgi:DNA-binding MurR/RpiR family transcriptional regulator
MKEIEKIFSHLEGRFEKLSQNQKLLGKYILDNYQKVAFATIEQLSAESGVSGATIVRFAKAMGYKGYPAFQKEIRRIVRADLKGSERYNIDYEFRARENDPLSRTQQKELENLSHLRETLDVSEFNKAVEMTHRSQNILVIGSRSTASLAYHLWFGLTKLELNVSKITTVNSEAYDRMNKRNRPDLVILIGFPRYLRDLKELLDLAKEKDVNTIIISDSPFSPFRGDINLYSPAESASFMAFHCAPLILINALIDHVGMLDRDRTLNALDRFEKLAAERKYFIKA